MIITTEIGGDNRQIIKRISKKEWKRDLEEGLQDFTLQALNRQSEKIGTPIRKSEIPTANIDIRQLIRNKVLKIRSIILRFKVIEAERFLMIISRRDCQLKEELKIYERS